MNIKQFVFSLVFKGDATSAKEAAKEAVDSVEAVQDASEASQAVGRGNAEVLEQEAAATREASKAAKDRALAEKEARDQAAGGQSPAIALPPQKVEELRERFVPMETAQKAYAKDLEAIALAERAGALTAAESAAARERLAKGFDATTEAIRRSTGATQAHGRAVKLTAHEQRILNLQLTDSWQSLMLGMPPLQVLLQQGPQITDLFGGIGNAARAAVSALTPMRLLLGGVSAVALVGAVSWNGYLQSVKEVDTAAAGLGRGMAGTRQEMEAAARAGADAADMSVKSARAMQAAFLRTGRIDGGNFEGLIGISKDFAATIGIEANAAGSALAEIFADPAKGADTLYRQYGLITAATAQLAKDLAAQNRGAEAQAVLIDALPGRLARAEEATTGLARAWASVSTAASDAFDWIGQAIDKAVSGAGGDERIAQIENILKLPRVRGRAELERELAELKAARDAAADDAAAAEAGRKSALALDIAGSSPANATAKRISTLRNEIAAMRVGLQDPGLSDTQQTEITRAIEAKSRALDGLAQKQVYQTALEEIELKLAHERNPIRRAELVMMQSLYASADQEITLTEAANEASRARNRVIAETIVGAEAQSVEMRTELTIRQQLAAQVSAGVITSAEANRMLQAEIALHPLVAAAAAANGKEQADLNRIIRERRELTTSLMAEEKRAQTEESLTRHARSQSDDMTRLRLEATLITATSEERRRALVLLKAEQDIRDMGLAAGSTRAQQLRDEAVAVSDLGAEVERLAEAWGRVDSATSTAIDGAIDNLLGGDINGALRAVGQEILTTWTELELKNPLKNMILGGDLPTMQDVGGLSGIWGRLTGQDVVASAGPGISTLTASSMSVTTPMVQLMAGQLSGLPSGNTAAWAGAPSAAGTSLTGGGDVQGQIWQFFAQRGLAPHQVAAIMGNVSAESAFNPLAVGDGGTSFGLFQHHADRGQGLLSAVGGQAGLGNVQAQLEYVWQELLTGERGVLQKLMAAPDVYSATQAFVGFERPQGWSGANPTGAMHWDQRLASAEAAMAKFEGTVASAGQGLGQLGTGMQGFGASLSQMIQGVGAQYGAGGIVAGGLLSGLGSLIGIPGFDRGGWTGAGHPSDVAGVVHAEEYVFDAATTRRIGVNNLEAIRRGAMPGYRTGGFVTGARPPISREAREDMAQSARAAAAPPEQQVTFNMNVSGTGDAQIMEGVRAAMQETMDYYDRNIFAGRVRMVLNDPRGE